MVRKISFAAVALSTFLALLAIVLVGCTNEECVDCGSCSGRELTEDLLDARPGYTLDREPVVTLRYDLAGTCAGSGERTYAVWRSPAVEVVTSGIEIDPGRFPESEPGSSVYLFRTNMLSVDIRRETGTSVVLAFLDGSGMPPGLRCEPVDGVLGCEGI